MIVDRRDMRPTLARLLAKMTHQVLQIVTEEKEA
jgi:acetyl-CoA carboxylase beta subunit